MRVRLLLRLAIAFAVLVSSSAFATDRIFSGRWLFKKIVVGQSKPYSTFTVTIDEDRVGNIRGKYCFITQNGNRIDCNPDNELNISGRISGGKNKAVVRFYSFFGASGGVAEITVINNRLLWKVVKQPEGGDYYGPIHAELRRDDRSMRHYGERKVVVGRAFLYDSPSSAHVSHIYVIKGDYVRLVEVSSDLQFWKIEFVTKDENRLVKWINCSDIDFCAR
ncbi:hypothetical protein BCO18175_04817 [Burkholderia contaminans]|nr:hypothetical protein BCO18175_04817 [Burkholderia contaminans]